VTNPDPKDAHASPVVQEPKLESLEARLSDARHKEDARLAADHAPMRATGSNAGWQIASTMVGYPLGGIIIGLFLDRLLGTLPWITIGLMFTAFAGALIQVARNNKTRVD
jgi:ATP synthase protein I